MRHIEDSIQKSIVSYLQLLENSGRLAFFSVPNGAHLKGNDKQRGKQMNKLKATGLKPGASDLVILIKGYILFVEVKTKTGRQSEKQIEFEQLVESQNGQYFVVRSLEDVEEILNVFLT